MPYETKTKAAALKTKTKTICQTQRLTARHFQERRITTSQLVYTIISQNLECCNFLTLPHQNCFNSNNIWYVPCINRPPADWQRRAGRSRRTWLRTIELDLQPYNLGSTQCGCVRRIVQSGVSQLVETAMLTDGRATR